MATNTNNGTGIVGNTKNQQASASINRADSKQDWSATISKVGIAFILLSVLIVLSVSELSLFWKLVASFVTYKIGSKLEDVKNHIVWKWPTILKVTGSVMAAAAILGSGIGLWTGSLVESIDTSALCAASPQEKVCVEKRALEKAEAENQRLFATTKGVKEPYVTKPFVPVAPLDSPTRVENVPACEEGWAKVDIPPGWNITMGWNQAAAQYQWRSTQTSNWEESPEGGADAVRFCAKYKPYVGDSMSLTWKKR